MGKKYNLLKNTKSVQYEPTFRHEYYKRLLAYYWLEIKTHFQNPLTYLFMLALIIVATFVATFIVTLFFTTNQKTGTSITLLVSLFGVISAYRLFFVSANTQFNSARLKQAYLYFPAKHVLRAQLLREFLSNVLLLFFYLCL